MLAKYILIHDVFRFVRVQNVDRHVLSMFFATMEKREPHSCRYIQLFVVDGFAESSTKQLFRILTEEILSERYLFVVDGDVAVFCPHSDKLDVFIVL